MFHWADFDQLSDKAVEEVRWWRENLEDINSNVMVSSTFRELLVLDKFYTNDTAGRQSHT